MSVKPRKLKDGTIVYDVREVVGLNLDGTPRRRQVTCKSLGAARVQQRLMAKEGGTKAGATLRQYVDEAWWPSLAGLSANTRSTYEKELRLRIMPALGGVPLREIDRSAVQSMVSACATEAVARKAVGVLKTILNEARADGHVDANPAMARFAYPPKGRPRDESTVVTTFDGMAAYVDAARTYSPAALKLAVTGFYMGLRPEERYGLDYGDFAPDMSYAAIERAYTAVSAAQGGNVLKEPKTPLSRRQAPVPALARDALAGLPWGEGPFIVGKSGRRITPSAAQTHWRACMRASGLPFVTLENMRHSFATAYLNAGGRVGDLSRILGHSDINTTYRRYVRPSNADLVAGIDSVVKIGR